MNQSLQLKRPSRARSGVGGAASAHLRVHILREEVDSLEPHDVGVCTAMFLAIIFIYATFQFESNAFQFDSLGGWVSLGVLLTSFSPPKSNIPVLLL